MGFYVFKWNNIGFFSLRHSSPNIGSLIPSIALPLLILSKHTLQQLERICIDDFEWIKCGENVTLANILAHLLHNSTSYSALQAKNHHPEYTLELTSSHKCTQSRDDHFLSLFTIQRKRNPRIFCPTMKHLVGSAECEICFCRLPIHASTLSVHP